MNVLILVTSPPSERAAWYAYEVAKALSMQHQVTVFFYQNAIAVANNNNWQPKDQLHLTQAWQQLAVQKWVCVAGALAHGIVDDHHVQQYQLSNATLAEGFELTGLGELATLVASSHKLVQF